MFSSDDTRLPARAVDDESKVSLHLEPPSGWAMFAHSEALVELVAEVLSTWRYLSFTSDTSTWEDPVDGCLVTFAFEGTAKVCEFHIVAPSAAALTRSVGALLEQLREAYGIQESR